MNLNEVQNGYWIDGVTRYMNINSHPKPFWKYYHYENKIATNLSSPTIEGLLTKMKRRDIQVIILTPAEFEEKMYSLTFIYDTSHDKFIRRNHRSSLNISLREAKKIIEKLDEGESIKKIYKTVPNPHIGLFAISYMDGFVEMPPNSVEEANRIIKRDVHHLLGLPIEDVSEVDDVEDNIDTVTGENDFKDKVEDIDVEDNIDTVTNTMTVDLTKQDGLNTVNHDDLEDRICVLENKIDYLFENCVVENKNDDCEDKKWWKRIFQR